MKEKIKVLHIIKSLGRGGAEMLLPETLAIHHQDEFEFHYIYFLPWKNQMVEAIQLHGGKVTCLSANHNLQLLLKGKQVIEYCRENKIQLIHAHLPWAGILARMVGKLTSIPVVYTEHNKQERYHFATRFMNLLTMNWLNSIVAVSIDVEESIRKHKKSITPRLKTIVNGVNVARFAPGLFDGSEVKHDLGIPKDAPVIGTIAVFRFQKRLDLWITLAKKILALHPSTHFIIVGDGPLKNELYLKRDAEQLQEHVHFVGLQTEVRPYLAAFDLYMMTSVFEGLPIALLEAMASGCAVISTDAGGIKEVIRHDLDGLLCSVDEPDKLVEYATRLLNNKDLKTRLAHQARLRVEQSFSISAMVEALETLYKEMVKHK